MRDPIEREKGKTWWFAAETISILSDQNFNQFIFSLVTYFSRSRRAAAKMLSNNASVYDSHSDLIVSSFRHLNYFLDLQYFAHF